MPRRRAHDPARRGRSGPLATSCGSWRTSYAVQRTTIRLRRGQPARAVEVVAPTGARRVWNAPSTSRTSDRARPGGRHSAVGPATPSRRGRAVVAAGPDAAARSVGTSDRTSSSAHRVRTAGDVAEGAGGTSAPGAAGGAARPSRPAARRVVSRCWTRPRGPSWPTRRGLVAGEEQDGRLDPAHGDARPRVAEQVERSAAAEESDAVDGLEAQLVVDEHRDLRRAASPEPVRSGRGQASEHAPRPGVQDREPQPLLPRQRAGRRADHPRACARPTARRRPGCAPGPSRCRWRCSCRRATMPAWRSARVGELR